MLGIDHQHGRWGEVEPGTDPGVSGGQREVGFQGQNREEVYAWVDQTCCGSKTTRSWNEKAEGLVRRYVEKMTGLSRAQVTRLISCYLARR